MSDRARVQIATTFLALFVSGACFGVAVGQGQRKEAVPKKAIRDVDPALFAIVAPGTAFTYRVSLKQGFKFDVGNNDGIVVTAARGNIVAGEARRVSATIFEQDFTSQNNGVGGSATLRINVTNPKGKLKFVRAAITVALPGGNELVTVNVADKTILQRLPVGVRPMGIDTAGLNANDFSTAFVANTAGGTVSVVDVPTNRLLATVPVGSTPSFVAVGGAFGFQTAYVTNAGSNTVTAIDAETFGVATTITVGRVPQGIAVAGTPNVNEVLYVANKDDDTVSVINTANNTVIQTIPVGDGPTGVAVNGPPGVQVVCVTNANANTVTLIDAASNVVIGTVAVGARPVAAAPGGADRNIFYVANQDGDSISVVNAAMLLEVGRVSVGVQPNGVTVAQATNIEEVYVSNGGDGTVSVVDTVQLRLEATIPLGGQPRGVATSGPTGSPVVLVSN